MAAVLYKCLIGVGNTFARFIRHRSIDFFPSPWKKVNFKPLNWYNFTQQDQTQVIIAA
jgi:hypothetical protein